MSSEAQNVTAVKECADFVQKSAIASRAGILRGSVSRSCDSYFERQRFTHNIQRINWERGHV
jgi:hypothetical protein